MNPSNRKLTNAQVLEIRTQFRDGAQQKILAIRFGVGPTSIAGIIRGDHYKDVPWPPSLSSSKGQRSLSDFPDYKFDSDGNVYSYKRNKKYGKKMRLWLSKKKYFMVPIRDSHGKQRLCRVNRIICMVFNGPPPSPRHQARHLNGDRIDNRAVNLAWGTQSQNELDKRKHGTNQVGEKVSSSKLTEDVVRKIRNSKQSSRKLAVKYGVSQPTILNVINRKTWKHVQ